LNSGPPCTPYIGTVEVAAIIVTRYDNSMRTISSKAHGRGRPRSGNPLSPAERMRRMRARRKAAGLRPVVSWLEKAPGSVRYSSHRILDARSLAMHVVAAEKIERNSDLLNIPRRNLERWTAHWGDSPPAWLSEWRQILRKPWPVIAALITEQSENATRLRQSSPFAGVLTPMERRRIYEAFRA
jgi:hypothetical protein